MAPLMDIADEAHPRIHLTRRNAKSGFLRLPVELRLKIYEYLLTDDHDIEPRQMAEGSGRYNQMEEGSNKFKDSCRAKGSQFYSILMPELSCSLTNFSLSQTCRHVYHDLEGYPIYYQVNTFSFESWTPLVIFLAAILPRRREAIRNLVIWETDRFWNRPAQQTHLGNSDQYQERAKRHVVSMLSLCKDLRDLEIRRHAFQQHMAWFQSLPLNDPGDRQWSDLERRIKGHAQDASSLSCLWYLPNIRPTISAFYYNVDLEINIESDIDLVNPEFPPRTDQSVKNWFKNIRQPLISLLERNNSDHRQGRGLLNEVTPAMVRKAIEASGVHLPGEDRSTQDRFNSNFGPVSSRTRQKCKGGDSITDLGIIRPVRQKYDANGLLLWKCCVNKLSWKGSAIECDLIGTPDGHPYAQYAPSKEPIHAVFGTHDGELAIEQYFYRSRCSWLTEMSLYSINSQYDIRKIKSLRKTTQDMISPQDVIDAMESYFDDWKHTYVTSNGEIIRHKHSTPTYYDWTEVQRIFDEAKSSFLQFLTEKEKVINSKATKKEDSAEITSPSPL